MINILWTIYTLWSNRRELFGVLLVVLGFVSLPILAVIVVTHTGINLVSDALVGIEPETKTIQLYNPADGSVIKELSGSFQWPTQGIQTLEFGESSLYQPFHTGLDIAHPQGYIGGPIYPFMPGKVIHVGNLSWGYGKHVIVDHGDNIISVYAHLCCVYVREGQEIGYDDVLGGMGTTGWSTGSHLHFEVRAYGIPVNPRVFLDASP